MQRFLINSDLQDKIIISDKDFIHQVSKVLRGRIGDKIILFKPNSSVDNIYEIININKKNIELKKLEKIKKENNNFKLNLYSALPNKLSKIELIIQKCTEVGVNKITFFNSERSQKLIISQNKKARLENIIKEATEQSNRNGLLKLGFIDKLDFKELEKFYFLHTKDIDSKHISQIKNNEKIDLLVGPEGGFSGEEIEQFKKNGGEGIYLGGNILRIETASITASFYIIQNNII
ncbi:MAG: 16S rRNA (uracil(1498)-N(3))-methyltransferase [Candidatus Gracilibacteria bacterium]|nr:16S rRNA (uracil(1498)-N(3))-methyltransferase [Candidatus Gracilibacteria bacterium]